MNAARLARLYPAHLGPPQPDLRLGTAIDRMHLRQTRLPLKDREHSVGGGAGY